MQWWIIGCLMMAPVTLQAQVTAQKTLSPVSFAHRHLLTDTVKNSRYVPFGTFAKAGNQPALPLPSFNGPTPSGPVYPVYMMTNHAYYDQHFGFFCKKEWSWQKQTGIPVKLRLGSYELTQHQEGKH
ncbi:hypothetical protein [Chitinophaga varians]|uniref:hypothetical protein n=1 Tax=Chitinophaga varians TaxID=2202339 RepID=UPI00165FE930|nr:hypothetical protein [Chitinophaga varians]MBC9910960.1 hypothetical protein [Chitinophaga varians]